MKTLQETTPGKVPTLATILVGNDPASATYVKMKGTPVTVSACILSKSPCQQRPQRKSLLDEIRRLNEHPDVQGILLQHPVPPQIDERRCFDAIRLDKDVDGVSCLSFGRMAMGERAYGAATPAGYYASVSPL